MKHLLNTYWIEVGDKLSQQYGVTAFSLDDAIKLLKEKIFNTQLMPAIKKYKKGIQFNDLDQKHVVPNMGPITERGIWFPISFFI